MMIWACIVPAAVIAVLIIKIIVLQRAADEISRSFVERLLNDTNTLIGISSRDRHMRALADNLNIQLKTMRALRLKYEHGDRELRNAITGISHDLRTPLTAISGYIELLEKESDPEKRARYISVIKNRTEALTKLSGELFEYSLDAAAEQELELTELSINAVLEESLGAFYQALNEREIEPQVELPSAPVVRAVNKAALSRVFGNIINNAVKYSDGDLTVRLSAEGEIRFENSAARLDSVLTEKLFDRFYTVENARGSTGLGLSIARTLTERMGGKITAEYRESRLIIVLRF